MTARRQVQRGGKNRLLNWEYAMAKTFRAGWVRCGFVGVRVESVRGSVANNGTANASNSGDDRESVAGDGAEG